MGLKHNKSMFTFGGLPLVQRYTKPLTIHTDYGRISDLRPSSLNPLPRKLTAV